MATREVTACRVNQEEQSTIQIMYNRGIRVSHIAQHLNVRATTVFNVLEDQDYDLDEENPAFMEKIILHGDKESCNPYTEPSRSSVSVFAQKSAQRCPPAESSRSTPTYKMEDECNYAVPRPVRSFAPSERSTPIESPRSTPILFGDRVSPLPDLHTFLKNLEHDLSKLASDLEAQGIGTVERLLAFAPWSEERLHELFKATLPKITVPQRFILVHGVKKYA
ncbi:hypothetical protein C0992_003457 [Termitomyces sp. T32_za158]|nr:hypothetical protein C0992_003457 [Termitomyces sp. T32_za158]